MAPFPLPSHAYLPGQNERHAEDAFEAIRNTAKLGQSAAQLADSDAFVQGLRFFHEGFYWEAHEVLEPVWMALPEGSQERQLVQALIQLANGRLKLRMGRIKAALRLVVIARELLPSKTATNIMGLEIKEVGCWIDELESNAKE